jgi:hypothetical protein
MRRTLGYVLALISWIAAITVNYTLHLRSIPYIRQEKQTQANDEDDEEFLKVLPSDSIMSSKHWDRSPIVVTKFKLLFFTMPKVGCTTWKQLFRRIRGKQNWKSQSGLLPHDPEHNDLVYLHRFNSTTYAKQIMSDPTWTKAIFVRDPKQRFLSAYLNKAGAEDGAFLKDKCCSKNATESRNCMAIKKCRECVEHGRSSLSSFLSLIHTCHNDHWEVQTTRMEAKYWKYINFVGHLDTMAQDGERLLRQIGAWEQYGGTGWGPHSNSSMFDKTAQKTQSHLTDSKSKVQTYYNPTLERQVEQFYHEDYDNPLFGFPKTKLTSTA